MDTKKKYGFYSQESVDKGHGFVVYEDDEGNRVDVTTVSDTMEIQDYYKWKDTVFVGIVVKCISLNSQRRGKEFKEKLSKYSDK